MNEDRILSVEDKAAIMKEVISENKLFFTDEPALSSWEWNERLGCATYYNPYRDEYSDHVATAGDLAEGFDSFGSNVTMDGRPVRANEVSPFIEDACDRYLAGEFAWEPDPREGEATLSVQDKSTIMQDVLARDISLYDMRGLCCWSLHDYLGLPVWDSLQGDDTCFVLEDEQLADLYDDVIAARVKASEDPLQALHVSLEAFEAGRLQYHPIEHAGEFPYDDDGDYAPWAREALASRADEMRDRLKSSEVFRHRGCGDVFFHNASEDVCVSRLLHQNGYGEVCYEDRVMDEDGLAGLLTDVESGRAYTSRLGVEDTHSKMSGVFANDDVENSVDFQSDFGE